MAQFSGFRFRVSGFGCQRCRWAPTSSLSEKETLGLGTDIDHRWVSNFAKSPALCRLG